MSRPPSTPRRLLLAFAASLTLLVPSQALAQPSEAERRQAQALFEQGRQLLEAQRYAQACPAFAESQRLDPGGGTLLNLALCHEKQGRVATAYTEYQEALSGARADKRQDREKFASLRIKALEGKIPRVRFEVASGSDGVALTIELDGTTVPELAWSTPTPIDPGAHRVVVSAPGRQSWQSALDVPPGAGELVVSVPQLEPVSAEAKPVKLPEPRPAALVACPGGARRVGGSCVAAPTLDQTTEERRLSTASWVLGGVGVTALGVSAVTGVMALSASSASNDAKSRAGCVPERGFCRDSTALGEYRDEAQRARSLAWVSTGTLVVGSGALLAAWLLPRARVSRPIASLALAPGALYVSVRGPWSKH